MAGLPGEEVSDPSHLQQNRSLYCRCSGLVLVECCCAGSGEGAGLGLTNELLALGRGNLKSQMNQGRREFS